MRTVSFVNFVEFEFQGNIMSKALTIGDVDNDNNNEIAIGNTDGELFIFKHIQDSRPWAKASGLGMISCLEIGDVTNQGINCLLSLSTEGSCNIFYLTPDIVSCPSLYATWDVGFDATDLATESFQVDSLPSLSTDEKPNQQQLVTSHSACQQLTFQQPPPQPQQQQFPSYLLLQPAHTQKLSSNAKTCVIADIDGDGFNELIVSFTDRVVRAFKWVPDTPITSQTCSTTSANVSSSATAGNPLSANFSRGKLHIHEKWKLAGQVSSMSVHKNSNGRVGVLVSQPGGSYVNLICSNDDQSIADSLNEPGSKSCGPSVCYHPLGSLRARNPYVSTEVISNIVGKLKGSGEGTEKKNFSAICTLDGTLSLIDGDDILWSIYVDHQLFALTKLDITGDNTEEVVACSWDGQTYIVNLSKDVVRFNFKDNVAAFCSGNFSLSKDQSRPCLCYATLDDKLVVFYDLQISSVGIKGMEEAIRERSDLRNELKKLNVDVDKEHQLKSFLEAVMYDTWRPAKQHTKVSSLKKSPVQSTEQPVTVTQTTDKPLAHTSEHLSSPTQTTKELLPESSLKQSLPPAQVTEQHFLHEHTNEPPLPSASYNSAIEQSIFEEPCLKQSICLAQVSEKGHLQEPSLEQSLSLVQATEQPPTQTTEQILSTITEQPLCQEPSMEKPFSPVMDSKQIPSSTHTTEQQLCSINTTGQLLPLTNATEQSLLQETVVEQSHSLAPVTQQPLLRKLSFEESLSMALDLEKSLPPDSDLEKLLSPIHEAEWKPSPTHEPQWKPSPPQDPCSEDTISESEKFHSPIHKSESTPPEEQNSSDSNNLPL